MVKVAVVLYSYSYCVAHFNQLIKQVTINQGHLCLVQCFCADVYRKCSFTMLNVQLLKIQTKLHLLLHIKSCQPVRGFYCETAIGNDNVCGGR